MKGNTVKYEIFLKSCICTMALYGSEVWNMVKKSRIEAFAMSPKYSIVPQKNTDDNIKGQILKQQCLQTNEGERIIWRNLIKRRKKLISHVIRKKQVTLSKDRFRKEWLAEGLRNISKTDS